MNNDNVINPGGYGAPVVQPSQVANTVNPNPMQNNYYQEPKKKTNVVDIVIMALLGLVAIAAASLAVMFYMNWDEAKTDVDGKVAAAERAARADQQKTDEENFAQREKQPNLEFTGPSDYGSLSFMYPRTWNTYVAKDATTGGDFEAYFNPSQVNPVSNTTIHALRVTIYDRPIEDVRKSYDALVKSGKLTVSVFQVGDKTGDRYDGEFSKDIVGSMVMLKINDKTAIIRTDAAIFRADFEAVIASIRHN